MSDTQNPQSGLLTPAQRASLVKDILELMERRELSEREQWFVVNTLWAAVNPGYLHKVGG